MKRTVLIPTKLDAVAARLLTEHGQYAVVQNDAKDLVGLASKHPDAYALIVRSEAVTPALIDALPNLRVIVRAGAGFNTIDTKYARRKGIDVMNTPGANANAVAEEVLAMILADARHIIPADASARRGLWEKKRFMGRELSGKTVGIVGLGNIGRLVARRLSGFDCVLLGYDPVISVERAKDMHVALRSLDELFAEADIITLHIPENDETRGMVNTALLERVKPGVTIVNCARAGIVDEDALRAAKAAKPIRFLNDVYPKDAEGAKSVADIADIMLPHLGASTHEANYNAARRAAEQLIDFDTKGITSFIVNRDIPEGLDESYCELANTLARLCRCLLGRGATPRSIQTSFYGSLEPYADWLLVPIVAGIWDDFDRAMDNAAGKRFLHEMGIEYLNRETDPSKGFENSITVEMTGVLGAAEIRSVSVRGTVAESVLMVSRINEFDKLWFEPLGHSVMFLYDDRPGVLGAIGTKLAARGINIEDVRNPHDARTNHSLAIMKVNRDVPEDVIRQIRDEIQALAAFGLKL
jgi:D-3-phosphoglycerate dehydrogenase / 2-oxoglutarate reductase